MSLRKKALCHKAFFPLAKENEVLLDPGVLVGEVHLDLGAW
jgi:hypothetical protein